MSIDRLAIAALIMPEVYRGAVEVGQCEQEVIAQEAIEMADALIKASGKPDARDRQIKRLKASLAAFKANSTRRRKDPREAAAKALGLSPKGEAALFGHL